MGKGNVKRRLRESKLYVKQCDLHRASAAKTEKNEGFVKFMLNVSELELKAD